MQFLWIVAILIISMVMDWWVMKKLKNYFQAHLVDEGGNQRVFIFGAYSPVLTWLQQKWHNPWLHLPIKVVRFPKSNLLEIGLIVAWAMYVGRLYNNFSLGIWPVGGEFIMGIQSNFIWPLMAKCGGCIFWNGFVNGGAPSFVDLHGGLLHPLVILTTLIWGPINGAKVTIIASLAIGGFAIWWLAKVMGLGRIARLWGAIMAVVSGYLAGRMENGLVPLLLSTASCSLVIPPAIELALTGKRRTAILLGITLALALLSGQGYMQVGLAIALFPALLVLLLRRGFQSQQILKEFILAFLLAAMLAGVFLVPFMHFYPNWIKDADTNFSSVQPMEYDVLNLVIRDPDFYRTVSLKKGATPYIYSIYVGWVPVILAIIAFSLVPSGKHRLLAFFIVALGLVYLASSANTLKMLAWFLPEQAFMVRYPSLISGIAGPLVIGLAAWGLDLLLKVKAPNISLTPTDTTQTSHILSINILWVLLVVPLLWSIKSAYEYGRNWLIMDKIPSGTETIIPISQKVIEPGVTQIVQVPVGDYLWYPTFVEAGLKLTDFFRPWRWKDREFPLAMVEGTHTSVDTSSAFYLGDTVGLKIISHPENQYAYVDLGDQHIPCAAVASGGSIDVYCQSNNPGFLVVMENQWNGWTVKIDGRSAKLTGGQWLSTYAPAGSHHFEFRYRPWDVVVGLMLTAAGLVLSIWLWWRAPSA
jgi:hypothetical protein